MSKDIDEMESMLNDYLQFAASQSKYKRNKFKVFDELENDLNK